MLEAKAEEGPGLVSRSRDAMTPVTFRPSRRVLGRGQECAAMPFHSSSGGQELLAHQLTHVVQQNGAGVQGKLTASQPGDALEREADQVAKSVMQRQSIEDEAEKVRSKRKDLQLQRQPIKEEEEELLQGKFESVQRQGLEAGELLQGEFTPGGSPAPASRPAIQRKAKTPALGNVDLFDYSVKPGGKATIAVADARRILTWKAEITALLQNVTGQSYDNDMRFLLVLAMKFTEQAGKKPVAQPEGNNPFNIMGRGPAGSFSRDKNKEYEAGKHVTRPAKFAAYETETQGIKAFLDILKAKWGPSYIAITQGGSIEDFAKGLRPKGRGHYLTKPLQMHIRDLRYRMSRLIIDLETIYAQSIAEVSAEIAALKPLFDFAVAHLRDGSIEDQRIRLDNAKNLYNRITKLEAYKAELQAEIANLGPIQERIANAQAIRDPKNKGTKRDILD
jgi:hypothetical protein